MPVVLIFQCPAHCRDDLRSQSLN